MWGFMGATVIPMQRYRTTSTNCLNLPNRVHVPAEAKQPCTLHLPALANPCQPSHMFQSLEFTIVPNCALLSMTLFPSNWTGHAASSKLYGVQDCHSIKPRKEHDNLDIDTKCHQNILGGRSSKEHVVQLGTQGLKLAGRTCVSISSKTVCFLCVCVCVYKENLSLLHM